MALGGQYCCPKCGQQYHPWQKKQGYIAANMVVICDNDVIDKGMELAKKLDPDRPAGTADPALGVPSGSTVGTVLGGQRVYPIVWQTTTDQQLVNLFKEITMGTMDELAQLPAEQRLDHVLAQVAKTPLPTLFKAQDAAPEAIERVRELNKYIAPHRQWKWDHIEGCQIHGFSAHGITGLDDPMSQKEFTRGWGMARWLVEAAQL